MYSAFQSAAGGWEVPSKVPSNEGIDLRTLVPRYEVRYSRACVTDFFLLAPGQEWSSLS